MAGVSLDVLQELWGNRFAQTFAARSSNHLPRAVIVFSEVMYGGQLAVVQRGRRAQLDGFLVRGNCAVKVVLGLQGKAESDVGLVIFRVQFDGLVVRDDCTGMVAHLDQCIAQVVVGPRPLRPQLDGLPVRGDRAGKVILCPQGVAQIVVRWRELRVPLDGP